MESRHSPNPTSSNRPRTGHSSRVNDIRRCELDDTALLGLLERSKGGVELGSLHISQPGDVICERSTSEEESIEVIQEEEESSPSSSSSPLPPSPSLSPLAEIPTPTSTQESESVSVSTSVSPSSSPSPSASPLPLPLPSPPASNHEAMDDENSFASLSEERPAPDVKEPSLPVKDQKPLPSDKPAKAEKQQKSSENTQKTHQKKQNDSASKPVEKLHSLKKVTKDKKGIRWAPLNIGLEKRAQTAIVLWHSLSIASFVALFFFICAIPLTWPLLIPYLVYVLLFSDAATNGNLTLRSEFFRSLWIWRYFGNYFPAQLHRTVPLPPTRKYVFGYHPHGILSHGAFVGFGTDGLGFSKLFPGITNTLLTLDSNFQLPFYREYALSLGLGSVSKESCENILSKGGYNGEGMGRAVTIVVGGARESLEAQPHNVRLILKRRKGFVKLAVRTGADLVPVLSFGENELYEQVRKDEHPYVHRAQLLVKKIMGFTIPLFHARGVFNYDVGMMPYRRPLNIVVGHPIHVEQCEYDQPDPEYVDKLHEQYIQELERLWEEHREEFSPESEPELQIK